MRRSFLFLVWMSDVMIGMRTGFNLSTGIMSVLVFAMTKDTMIAKEVTFTVVVAASRGCFALLC